jgi:hypothetical protein
VLFTTDACGLCGRCRALAFAICDAADRTDADRMRCSPDPAAGSICDPDALRRAPRAAAQVQSVAAGSPALRKALIPMTACSGRTLDVTSVAVAAWGVIRSGSDRGTGAAFAQDTIGILDLLGRLSPRDTRPVGPTAPRHPGPKRALPPAGHPNRLLKKCRSDSAAYQNPENPSRNGI